MQNQGTEAKSWREIKHEVEEDIRNSSNRTQEKQYHVESSTLN